MVPAEPIAPLPVLAHFHLIWKNYTAQELLRHSGKLMYAEARLLAAAIRQKYARAYCWGVWNAILEAPRIWPKRSATLAKRTVSSQYLDSVIDARFAYQPIAKALRRK